MLACKKLTNGLFRQVSECIFVYFVCEYYKCMFEKFLRTVYKNTGYMDILNYCAKVSMLKAIDKVKALPGYWP